MAEETSTKQILPIYKEKVIFFGSGESGNSYPVSSSYKGILRLSPNDGSSLKTENSSINYADSIGKYIKNEPIQVSDSEGNMLDMKYKKDSVSISTVYVVGMASPKKIYLFAKDENSFSVGNNLMPIRTNDLFSGNLELDNSNLALSDLPYGGSWISSNTKKISNHSSILNFEVETRNVARWKFQNTRKVVEKAVIEAILSLRTVPSGSVHYFPLTYNQYVALLEKNSGKGPNIVSSDPIIRDYLLCDGRRYLTRDFPELAKILNGETINFERPYNSGNSLTLGNISTEDEITYTIWGSGGQQEVKTNVTLNDTTRLRRFTHINGSESDTFVVSYKKSETQIVQKTIHTFRVPDLRHTFPKSALFTSAPQDERNFNKMNKAGSYFIDYIPMGTDGIINDHFHFTFFGSYSMKYWDPYPCKSSSVATTTASDTTPYRIASTSTKYHNQVMNKASGASFAILANNSWYLDYTGGWAKQANRDVATIFGHTFVSREEGHGTCYRGLFNPSNYVITSGGEITETTPTCGRTGPNMNKFDAKATFGASQEGYGYYYTLHTNSNDVGTFSSAVKNPKTYAQETTPTYIGFLPLIKI